MVHAPPHAAAVDWKDSAADAVLSAEIADGLGAWWQDVVIDDHTTDSRILTPRRARVRCKLQCGTHVDEPLCRRLEVIHALESSAIERSAVTMAAGSGAR